MKRTKLYVICLVLCFVVFVVMSLIPETYDNIRYPIAGVAFMLFPIFAIAAIVSAIRDKKRNKKMQAGIEAVAPASEPASKPSPVPVGATLQTTPSNPATQKAPVKNCAAVQPHIPFEVPEEYMGGILSYSYDDVQIEVAENNIEKIKDIPDHTRLTFKRYDEEKRIELYKGDLLIGSMYDNKLRSMTFDFLRNPDKHLISVLLSSAPVTIGLYFYNPISSLLKVMEKQKDSKVFKLVSNGNREMQESIESCDEGDSVDFDYDYDKEKYLVSVGPWDIGFMPTGFNRYMEEHENIKGRIYEIVEPEDDDEKYTVSVIVVPAE